MRRFAALCLAAFSVVVVSIGLGGAAFAADAGSGSTSSGTATSIPVAPTTTIDNSFLDTKRDLSECVGHSVDLPDCGIEPTEPGDPGGALQVATFFAMTIGIVIICWVVYRSVKARDRALAPKIPTPSSH
ncbi:MAG TPA: hypothetical protein VGM78_14270 [Ilumatobacteraceae bacterium]|jgi:hypothetical protein